MSGVVHYKFKSARAFSSVSFSGAFIKVGILKRTIAEQEGLLKSNQSLDLLLTNSQDGTGLCLSDQSRVSHACSFARSLCFVSRLHHVLLGRTTLSGIWHPLLSLLRLVRVVSKSHSLVAHGEYSRYVCLENIGLSIALSCVPIRIHPRSQSTQTTDTSFRRTPRSSFGGSLSRGRSRTCREQ